MSRRTSRSREGGRAVDVRAEGKRGGEAARPEEGRNPPRPTASNAGSIDAGELEARSAFESEMLRHLDSLYGFALKLSRSRDDADDLVSETVMRALEKWRQYQPGTNLRAWMFTILYHAFVSRKRRIERREVHPGDDSEGWSAFDVVGDADPEGAFFDSFVDEEITAAIDELPDEYRDAVMLSDVHDLRYSEVAEILGVPEGTVKSRLFRARRILQKKLLDYALEMGYVRRPPDVIPA